MSLWACLSSSSCFTAVGIQLNSALLPPSALEYMSAKSARGVAVNHDTIATADKQRVEKWEKNK